MNSHQLINRSRYLLGGLLVCLLSLIIPQGRADINISNQPLFLGGSGIPLSLLVMGRDHKLYYEAYNDASDLNQDGEIDVGYKPDLQQDGEPLDYYGYFDSYKCYQYTGSGTGGKYTPVADTDAGTKKCTNVNAWSGDFLNYLTTARIDAVRRVLYGGYRVTDTDSATVLERARVPQDAHSWGKEYLSIAHDGFDIREYSTLDLPESGTRHLFANTTLLCPNNNDPACATFAGTGLPLLRILNDSTFRVWEWLSIERPVAGHQCVRGSGGSRVNCAVASTSTQWEIVPSSAFLNLTQTTYTLRDPATPTTDVNVPHPNNHAEYDTMVSTYATTARRFGSGTATNINGSGNPFDPNDINEDYLNIFEGQIVVPTAGTYNFAVDGDDAVEVIINGTVVASWYGGHGRCNCQTYSGSITLSAGTHTIEFRHEENFGGDNYYLYWQRTIPASAMTDHVVRVDACVDSANFELESECRAYQLGDNDDSTVVYKPTGILHEYGETDRMAFGLVSGTYQKHLSGGALRKNMSSFANEVNADTGVFIKNDPEGSIVDTIDKIQVVGFRGSYAYADGGCGVPMVTPMQEGRCAMWGNPVAEMMYEGLRYFAAAGSSSPFTFTGQEYDGSGGVSDPDLTLPLPTWKDPYRDPDDANDPGYNWCSKPFEIVIADAPSFDTDQLPGKASEFNITSGVTALSNSLTGLDVESDGQTIWNGEFSENTPSPAFIGQSGSTYDTAPTPKTVTSFGNIRGLAPEEPTREGGYYAASVAYHGKTTGVRTLQDGNGDSRTIKTDTFGVSLSSPLPQIEIPVNYIAGSPPATPNIITVVPFAKSVGGSSINATEGQFQPTNTIVDFYVEQIANTGVGNDNLLVNGGRPFIRFRLNYEDSEYGSDHDMDAIVTYTFAVNSDQTLTIDLSSDYEAGGILHHMGYVISGTTADGVYLEVRDANGPSGGRSPSNDVDYFLDTPPTYDPAVHGGPPAPDSGAGSWDDNVSLPVTASRTFTSGTASANFIPIDPLWLAAKWGGFVDADNDNQLDGGDQDKNGEWDADGDGKPDAYFLVTNAGKLKEQLQETFTEISKRVTSAAAVAVNTGSLSVGSRLFQARFDSTDWTGELRALSLNPDTGAIESDPQGDPLEVWAAQDLLTSDSNREILTFNPSTGDGAPFQWPSGSCTDPATGSPSANLDQNQCDALNGSDNRGELRLDFLRGDRSDEGDGAGDFRIRADGKSPSTVLGDIVNSNPFYVGPPAAGYTFSDYQTFASNQSNRRPMLYMGSNDGMLHGFDANTGEEVFGYVPSLIFQVLDLTDPVNPVVLSELNALTEQGYDQQHRYFVDGAPTARDVYFGGSWHTVLVGGLRAGGYGYFALDVTNAGTVDNNGNVSGSQLTESNAISIVLWEFSNTNSAGDTCDLTASPPDEHCDPDLGLTFNQPSLVRLHDNDGIAGNNADNNPWAVVFGNGYNNTGSGKAALFILNVDDGSVRRKFADDPNDPNDTCLTESDNGLSTPTVIDFNNDTLADFIYAGDLLGNLWKFDIRDANASNWTCEKLFVAEDGSGNPQPITSAPEVVRHPEDNPGTDVNDTADDEPTFLILFGTGRYVGTDDITNTDEQTFYGIWDDREPLTTPITRGELAEQIFCRANNPDTEPTCETQDAQNQTVVSGGEFTADGRTFRVTSARPVTYDFDTTTVSQRGWFLDLDLNAGERVVGDAVALGGRIIFSSILPNPDECAFGGSGWVNILDFLDGTRIRESFLSCCGLSTDGQVIEETTSGFPPSSVETVGIISAPTVVKGDGQAFIYNTTSGGEEPNDGPGGGQPPGNTGPNGLAPPTATGLPSGRQSWRQLEFL